MGPLSTTAVRLDPPAVLSVNSDAPCGRLVCTDRVTNAKECAAGIEENVNVDTPERIILLGSRHNPFAISTHVFFGFPRLSYKRALDVCIGPRKGDSAARGPREVPAR